MGSLAPLASAFLLILACAQLWGKARWRSPRSHTYSRGPLPEQGTVFEWIEWANWHAYIPPFSDMPFTPTLGCEPRNSSLLDRFDWLVSHETAYVFMRGCGRVMEMPYVGISFKGDPRTVWAMPEALPRLFELVERHCDPSHNNRSVVFGGGEFPIGAAFGMTEEKRNRTVARLQKYFNKIGYQTKDIPVDGVHLAPMGFCWGYMLPFIGDIQRGHRSPVWSSREAGAIIKNASRTRLSMKTRWVLATASYRAAWLDQRQTLMDIHAHKRRSPHDTVIRNYAHSNVHTMLLAYTSRQRLRRWVRQPAAMRAGVYCRQFNAPRWWQELPRYRFLLNPMGSGGMTAKTSEALFVLTIPIIMHRGYPIFFDLVRMGFPLVLIRDWPEVKPKRLRAWWKQLSPRLESFRKNCLTTDAYWRIMIGEIDACH